MSIRVEAVTSEIIDLGNSVLGYRVHFVAGAVRGQAWFASTVGPPSTDTKYSIETGMESIRDLRIAAPSVSSERGITPLPKPGDYRVRGIVTGFLGERNGTQAHGAYISAEEWSFMLDRDDCGSEDLPILDRLKKGDEVEFEAAGLSLWDENL